MPSQSFERYYLKKIAVGEGCGCAEQALGMRDIDTLSRKLHLRGQGKTRSTRLDPWLRKLLSWRKTTISET